MRISDWSSDVCSSDLWAYFIGLGHYSAALVRAGRVLAERRTALRDALNHYLHERVSIETAPGASAYWVSVPAGMDARELARQAAAIGVLVDPGCRRDGDRKSVVSGKSVSVRVVLGGRLSIKKKKRNVIVKEHGAQIIHKHK